MQIYYLYKLRAVCLGPLLMSTVFGLLQQQPAEQPAASRVVVVGRRDSDF